ncbi:4-hydroxybenzoate polyprenyltransferase, mitochondrial [Anthonomus grandis grandis]|uniref:4-hydroxybenzoate polyprenyltransferase, mitochondrial n=1 Tax=Anthonomus grandis grandis TaxID=2921223 RepID=UPI002166B23C|nr:4-hydroxybenzoate polyprenyltransferase, mitochondrial [Anthonomus grandis grandis]
MFAIKYFKRVNQFPIWKHAAPSFEVRNHVLNHKIFFEPYQCSTTSATQDEKKNDTLANRFVNKVPQKIRPYLKLMRLDRPVGSWLLFWPGAWGIASAASPGCLPDMYLLTLFGAGSVIMRGAGCTINDMWDRNIDSKVDRTKDRPLVCGDISMKKSVLFLGGQLSLGLAILLQLNWYSVALGASSLALVITYPLMKRITYWPQLVLGFTFNWGTLLGYSAVKGFVDPAVCVPLYLAGVCWTIVYDTIYAHQDRLDDLRIGIKSTAIRFNEDTKIWLTGFTLVMSSLLVISGLMNSQTWPFYCAVGLVSCHLLRQIFTLNINNALDCSQKFISNSWVGFILVTGIILGNYFKGNHVDKNVGIELEKKQALNFVA